MKEVKLKLIYIFVLLQPLIDLITALMTRFDVTTISFGIIIRGIFFFLMLVYIFFINKSKYRKKSIIYLLILGLFYFIYIITKQELLTKLSMLYNELVYIFKYSYFIVLFITIVNFADEYRLKCQDFVKFLIINLLLYSIMIIIPTLTNTGFNSYNNHEGYGIVGWFYSANEISAIFSMLYPFLLLNIDKKCNLKNIGLLIITIISIIILGTKAPYYSMLLITIFMVIYYLFNLKKKIPQFILVLAIVLLAILGKNYTPVNVNLENRKECFNDYINGEINNEDNDGLKCEVAEGQQIVMLSGREALLNHVFKIYKNSSVVDKFFGIGFSNRKVLNEPRWSIKLVEMDLFDILFRYGIIGFIIYIIPISLIIIKLLKYALYKKFKLSLVEIIYGYSVAIGIATGLFIGHVFGTPSSSFYLAIVSWLAIDKFTIERAKLNKNKITFLSLHLGVGGIENATINTANSLCNSKDVEIICFYHLQKDPIYKIDKRVKIRYLYEGKPNKEELLEAIKKRHIISIIKNSLLACSILWKRHHLMIKEIKKIKEGIVISTRVEFSVLLSEYGHRNILKVAQEHRYHNNNKKYIKKMQNNYANLDYVMALTKTLEKDYKTFFKGTKPKVVLMPNMLEESSEEKSNLQNKNIIFVGRLSPEKRVNDLIDIAYELKDNDWKFNIIGDGKDKDSLIKQIQSLNLNNITLLGSYPHDKVIKELCNSSIFIMTSITEGLPMVLLEAMNVGLPCIAYETPSGVGDIITNNKDGYIIKNRNKEGMVNKLKLLMDDKKLRIKMGHEALLKAQMFSKEAITKKWLDFIDNISL